MDFRSRVESVMSLCGFQVSLCRFQISSHLLALWCDSVTRGCHCSSVQTSLDEQCLSSGAVSGQKLADIGLSMSGPAPSDGCTLPRTRNFFVGLERMDDGKDGCLSHTLLPYGLPTGGMT